jgi:hypothetical protein
VAKIRVYELAKELGVESKQVMTKLQEMGEFVRSASSTVEPAVVRRLRASFTGTLEIQKKFSSAVLGRRFDEADSQLTLLQEADPDGDGSKGKWVTCSPRGTRTAALDSAASSGLAVCGWRSPTQARRPYRQRCRAVPRAGRSLSVHRHSSPRPFPGAVNRRRSGASLRRDSSASLLCSSSFPRWTACASVGRRAELSLATTSSSTRGMPARARCAVTWSARTIRTVLLLPTSRQSCYSSSSTGRTSPSITSS